MTATPTLPIRVQSRTRRRGRRVLVVLLIVLVLIAVLAVVAFVVGEPIFRTAAEGQIERSVESSLPAAVKGRVTAQIRGGSALQQWAAGSFDDVRLVSKGLTVNGAPATARFEVHGLPVDGSGTLTDATGTMTVGQAAFKALPALRQAHASAPKLRAGHVTTTVKQTYLGIPVDIVVTLAPALRGQVIRLTPTAATIRSGFVSLPGTALVKVLLPNGVSVCAASSLPPGVRLTSITIGSGTATAALAAKHLALADLESGRTGTCG